MKLILFIALLLSLFKLRGSDSSSGCSNFVEISGTYKAGNETLRIEANTKKFYLKRTIPKLQDVVVPLCYDTLAKGTFQIIGNQLLKLKNDIDFQKVYFSFNHEMKLSEDTIYIELRLPNEDAFISGRFNYLLHFGCGGSFTSKEKLIKVPRNKILGCKNNSLGLVVQDLDPYCNEDRKCYQRIYFRIFDLLNVDQSSNYFTVIFNNFTECFVERMDVEDDLLYFDGKNSIYWRGMVFKKLPGK